MVDQAYVQKLKEEGWPQEYNAKLKVGNLSSNVGIATLWTFKDVVHKNLDSEKYCVLGNYYDRVNALDPFVRNCLANPNIRYVILLGNDKAQSRETLVNFFRKGFEDGKVAGTEVPLPRGIPEEELQKLRENVQLFDLTDDIADLGSSEEYAAVINKVVGDLESKEPYDEPKIYEKPPLDTDSFPSSGTGYMVKGKTVGETWLKVLNEVYNYGKVTKMKVTDNDKVRVCTDVMAVISDEDPDDPKMEEYFRFDKDYLLSYYDEICTDKIPEGTLYTYGSRLRAWQGIKEGQASEKIDQVEDVIKYLKPDILRTSAVMNTWIVEDELTRRYLNKDKNSPCIVLVHPFAPDGRLHLTVYIRSNDMFRGWTLNAFGLRKLQKIIAQGLGIDMGDLIMISSSAHIYEENWEDTKKILKDHYYKNVHCFYDGRGYYTIALKEGKIFVQHFSPDSQLLKEYQGTSAREINDMINSTHHTTSNYHAGYLGEELMKAEIALVLGREYRQDAPVDVNGKKFGYVFNEDKGILEKWDTVDGSEVSGDVCDDSCELTPDESAKEEGKKRGMFIVFEGIDGCGKSTQMKMFADYLFEQDKHNHVIMTREPYDDTSIRKELNEDGAVSKAEMFANLFIEDRKKHTDDLIESNLKKGHHVICDRYKMSTLAFQGAQGLDMHELIDKHEDLPVPDMTFIIDTSVNTARERMGFDDRKLTKFEDNSTFLEKVRSEFSRAKDILADEKVFIINGEMSIDEIFSEVKRIFEAEYIDL